MGYLHINNLYKDQTILIFKECYALEKIHGTSAHVRWNAEKQKVSFFSGGETHEKFVSLFDAEFLEKQFVEKFPTHSVVIYGEAYGGKQQGMKATYGDTLRFVAFDVKVGDVWVKVPDAEGISKSFNIEFVDYCKVSTDLESLDAERDKDSTQAIRNGCGEGKIREGVVLRPLIEFTFAKGGRIIAKHKRHEFRETKTPREVNPEEFKLLEDAKAIAEEWVTPMRLEHVLGKLTAEQRGDFKAVIIAMIEDVYREAKGEIVESKEVRKAISRKTASLLTKIN